MMSEVNTFSIDDGGYFGVTFLDIGSYAAHLMHNRVEKTKDVSKLHFDNATSKPYIEKRAITIEGDASSISTPGFALRSLEAYAGIAREMDELVQTWAS